MLSSYQPYPRAASMRAKPKGEIKMRHYEIVFLIHPDQGNQTPVIIQRYEAIIKSASGAVHRLEDWGRRQLAYPINKASKANYVLMNIECDEKTLAELTNSFRFNDAILRHLVLSKNEAITTPSPIVKPKEVPQEEAERAFVNPAKKFASGRFQEARISANPIESEVLEEVEIEGEEENIVDKAIEE